MKPQSYSFAVEITVDTGEYKEALDTRDRIVDALKDNRLQPWDLPVPISKAKNITKGAGVDPNYG